MCCCGCRSRCGIYSGEWLMANYPDRYRHIFTLIRDMRGGRDATCAAAAITIRNGVRG